MTETAPPAPEAALDGGHVAPNAETDEAIERRLDPRVITVQRLGRWIATTVLASALLMSTPAVSWRVIAGYAVPLALLVFWAQVWPAKAYRHTSYRIDAAGIEIRRGVIWRRVINVPRSRVQHTDVSQGPIERSYGLGTLTIHTAGTEYARVQLEGLAHADALELRNRLLPAGSSDAV
jgi:membrane protein YdbS with pleckstrin-like domain